MTTPITSEGSLRRPAGRPHPASAEVRSADMAKTRRLGAALLATLALTLQALTFALPARAQVPMDRGLVGTSLDLRGLDGLKRVLLIGAHPDDEDTALLTALARGAGAETAYLSLTRGGGGQNLIGPELGEGLGAIRTGELLAARELDGGKQFFTRAIDFGYSKTAEETITMWNEEAVLRDVALVIRRFRPHVIVSVWQGSADTDGHGHHIASGLLSKEGFEAAADPERFPELTEAGYPAWTTPKLYLLNRRSGEAATTVETGVYDPLLGRSWHQIAMDSRSQHRSQDMGTSQPFGPRSSRLLLEAVQLSDGRVVRITDVERAPTSNVDPAETFFAGVDTTLVGPAATLPGGARIATALTRYRGHIAGARTAVGAGDLMATAQALAEALPPLTEAILGVEEALERVSGADRRRAEAYLQELVGRQEAAESALLDAAGVVTRAVVEDDLIVPGDTVAVEVEVWNGGPFPVEWTRAGLTLPEGWSGRHEIASGSAAHDETDPGYGTSASVAPGQVRRWRFEVAIPVDAELSRLYYRERPTRGAMHVWPEERPDLWALAKAPRPIGAEVSVQFAGTAQAGAPPLPAPPVAVAVQGEYLGVDKAMGEFSEPPLVVPAVSVAVEPGSLVWPAAPAGNGADAGRATGDAPMAGATAATAEPLTKEVTARLDAWAEAGAAGMLALEVPAGWRVEPASVSFDLAEAGQQEVVTFRVTPDGAGEGRHTFRAVATTDRIGSGARSASYTEGFTLLDYPHIERMAFFTPAETGVSVVPVRVDEVRVGYIQGSGDDGLLALNQMGVDARHVDAAELRSGNLSEDFDVLVLGIRVYETQPEIAALNDRILAFAEAGGTVVTQYNKFEYPRGGYAPYDVSMSVPGQRSAPRATDETSPVEFIHPTSPVLNQPNDINRADFEGWVQERGLYFLGDWDDAFVPQLRFRDPGEEWTEGSLVVAPVGEGLYVYTGISFFRQFPAGVPGAYRLFANLVSLDRESWDAWSATR